MPFGSAFSVHNLGISLERLPLLYLITGSVSIVAGPLIGRFADRSGKFPVFFVGSMLTIGTVLVYTRLGVTPLPVVILISSIMFVGISSRMIASSALMSAVPNPAHRGSFMSVNASLQQAAGGVGAAVAGLIVVQLPSGKLAHYDVLGYVVVSAMFLVVVMLRSIDRMVRTAR